jgi:ATP-dependent phosphofructokinase / diphosphate-dependent phosphofructokinase
MVVMIKNVLVGQSGGPTAVINSSLAGVCKAVSGFPGCKTYGMLHGIQGLLEKKIVDLTDTFTSELDLELLKRTPSSYLGSCRYKLPDFKEDSAVYRKLFAFLNEMDIGIVLYIGGNDSMDTISKLSDYGNLIHSEIRFVGVPKTIDNDLEGTDHTPGFGSAAKFIATTIKEVVRDSLVYDTRSVTVVEIMGRNAGWLTASSALAAGEDCEGTDLIYLPEVPFEDDAFLTKLEAIQKVKKSVIIAASEGIKTKSGQYVCDIVNNDDKQSDAFGHAKLTGSGRYLSMLCAKNLGCKSRAIEFSTLQRCASHMVSRVDITEAFQCGGAAVSAAMAGETGKMVGLKRISTNPYQCTTQLQDIHSVANFEKKVPLELIGDDHSCIKSSLVDYMRPLIQAELTPIMVDGLPRHIYLKEPFI